MVATFTTAGRLLDSVLSDENQPKMGSSAFVSLFKPGFPSFPDHQQTIVFSIILSRTNVQSNGTL